MRKICNNCIMDDSDPNIIFDEHGVCNYCNNFIQRNEEEVKNNCTPKSLEKLISKIKKDGKNKKYDCVVGVSGGVDSSYVLYLSKKLGLRPLAVHLDNGWNSELAIKNIENTLNVLGVDLYTYVLNWEDFKDIQLSFLKASVPNCEVPTDHAIIAANFIVADKFNVKYILNGSNVATESFVPTAWAYDCRDDKHIVDIWNNYTTKKFPRTYPLKSPYYFAYQTLIMRRKWVSLLNYVNYNKKEAINTLISELDWRAYGDKHFESIFTRFYQGYLLKYKFGYDKMKAHLSCLIQSNQISRTEALNELRNDDYYNGDQFKEDYQYILKKFGLTKDEFDIILKNSPVSHNKFKTGIFFGERLKNLYVIYKRFVTSV